MTKIQAKALALEVWEHLAAHPEIETKENLTQQLWGSIKGVKGYCPLCEVFRSDARDDDPNPKIVCGACPLNWANNNCLERHSAYKVWSKASNKEDRQKAATRIVEIVRAWAPNEESCVTSDSPE